MSLYQLLPALSGTSTITTTATIGRGAFAVLMGTRPSRTKYCTWQCRLQRNDDCHKCVLADYWLAAKQHRNGECYVIGRISDLRDSAEVREKTKATTVTVGGSTGCWLISTYPCANHSQPLWTTLQFRWGYFIALKIVFRYSHTLLYVYHQAIMLEKCIN